MHILERKDLFPAQRYFATLAAVSRAHGSIAWAAVKAYGDHGPQISGCVRDHFPEDVKDTLRYLAHQTSAFSDLAWAARPPRVQRHTMLRLKEAVYERDGRGFYG